MLLLTRVVGVKKLNLEVVVAHVDIVGNGTKEHTAVQSMRSFTGLGVPWKLDTESSSTKDKDQLLAWLEVQGVKVY